MFHWWSRDKEKSIHFSKTVFLCFSDQWKIKHGVCVCYLFIQSGKNAKQPIFSFSAFSGNQKGKITVFFCTSHRINKTKLKSYFCVLDIAPCQLGLAPRPRTQDKRLTMNEWISLLKLIKFPKIHLSFNFILSQQHGDETHRKTK